MVVPPWFRNQPQLVLQIGLNLPVPIRDLHLDDDGVSCTLSFNRSPFFCVLPWTSVYAMADDDGRAMVWPDDVPAEVQAKARQSAADEARKEKAEPPVAKLKAVRSAPKLEAVPAEPKGAAKKAEGAPAQRKSKNKLPKAVPVPEGEGVEAGATSTGTAKDGKERPHAPVPALLTALAEEKESKDAEAKAPSPAPKPAVQRPSVGKPKRELPPYLRVVK